MSLKVIGTETYRSATYDFLLAFYSNHGTISHHFRDRRLFHSKIANFPTPVYFNVIAEGVPLGIRYRRKGVKKTRMMRLSGDQKRFKIDLTV